MAGSVRSSVVPAIAAVLALVAAVVLVDVLAILGVMRARHEAVAIAETEARLQVELAARTVEAALSSARADLAVLAATDVLKAAPESDPVEARRARLARESALLLYAVGHPTLDEIVLERDGVATARIGRVESEPVVLEPARSQIQTPLWARLVDGSGATLVARAGGTATLAALDAGGGALSLRPASEPPLPARDDELLATATLTLPGWLPEHPWRLERREPRRAVLLRVEELASDYRQTLAIHLVLILLTVGLAAFALRGVRRSARLAAERALAEERRELERRMWHADRLASVGRLAAGMAHEINNPLAGVTTWLALLEEDVGAGETARAQTTLAKVRQGLERIRDVVGSTLTFAAPGKTAFEPVDLVAVVRDTVAFVEALEDGFEIRTLAPEAPLVVVGDRRALGQLTLNLLVNSSQAQAAGGEATVRLASEAREVTLIVEDPGPGVPADVLARLFEPFTSSRGSAGLGLAVCHGIVRAHGGSIAGENRPEGGARFTVRLPRAAEGTNR